MRLFRRHVGGGAHSRAGLGQLGAARRLRQAEIHDLGDAVGGHNHVGRLDVAVHQSLGVGLGQPLGHLQPQLRRFWGRQRTALDLLLDRLAVVIGHGDEQLAILGLVDFVDGADVRMVERGGGFGLVDEPLLLVLLGGKVMGQKLEGDETIQPQILSLVDHAHASFAELCEDLVTGGSVEG